MFSFKNSDFAIICMMSVRRERHNGYSQSILVSRAHSLINFRLVTTPWT
jgi:hypothetical protein